MSYLKNFDAFWQEVELRAMNNYGNYEVGEEVETNVNKAIQELADELKSSGEAKEVTGKIIDELEN